MTEKSIPWSGISTGHAGPYTDNDWSDVWRKLFTIDRTVEGVLGGYANCLNVTNPAGATIRVASGAGMVDGKFYENTANIDFTISAPGVGTSRYDLVVLRKTMTAQTVKAAILTGVEDVAPSVPALTQDSATIYEVAIAKIYITDVPVITITEMRKYLTFASNRIDKRQGGSATVWATSGTITYNPGITYVQLGANTITIAGGAYRGSVAVTFPQVFSYTPVVFANCSNDDYITQITVNAANGCTIAACQKNDAVGAITLTVYWLAIGPR